MSAPLGTLVAGASGGHDRSMAVGRRLVVATGGHFLLRQAGDLRDGECGLHRYGIRHAEPIPSHTRKDHHRMLVLPTALDVAVRPSTDAASAARRRACRPIGSISASRAERAWAVWAGEPNAETIEDIKDRNDESRVLRPRWPVRLGPQCNEHGDDAVVLIDDNRP